jgi:hypothetical protein
MDSRRDKLRRAVRQRVRETQALLGLSARYNQRLRDESNRVLGRISRLTARDLKELLEHLDAQLAALVRDLRPTSDVAGLAKALETALPRGDALLWVPRWHLRELVPGLDERITSIRHFPQHARIGLDIHGFLPEDSEPEVRILEAALFEDMCTMVNAAQDLSHVLADPRPPKADRKRLAAFRRAAVFTAFNMVEAYLNSVAFDALIERGAKLTSKERDILSEWDSARGRQRLVNFRGKLLQYPRLAVGAVHPPLQESNSDAFATLVGEAKDFRDSIVHANPRPSVGPLDLEDPDPKKEMLYWQVADVDDMRYLVDDKSVPGFWLIIVDAAISVIRQIENVLRPNTHPFWLRDRSADGRFDESVFD